MTNSHLRLVAPNTVNCTVTRGAANDGHDPDRCKLIWGIEIFRTPRATQRSRRTGSRAFGESSRRGGLVPRVLMSSYDPIPSACRFFASGRPRCSTDYTQTTTV
jgi:hypothetical protein